MNNNTPGATLAAWRVASARPDNPARVGAQAPAQCATLVVLVMLMLGLFWAGGPSVRPALAAQTEASAAPASVVMDAPGKPAQALSDALIASMQGGERLGLAGRTQLLESVLPHVFAFPYMARVSLGPAWNSLSIDERRSFTELYADWSAANYALRFNEYKGQHFEAPRVLRQDGSKAEVQADLVKADGDHVAFVYSVRGAEGRWRVVDIKVRGVSQLALTRSQFAAILDKDGYPELLRRLAAEPGAEDLGPAVSPK